MSNMKWEIVNKPKHRIPNAEWVLVIAHIRKNETGEILPYETHEVLHDCEDRPSVFNWEENNYCCDCNRFLFFERAKGNDPDPEDVECTHGKYSVNLENPVTGEIYYSEFEEIGAPTCSGWREGTPPTRGKYWAKFPSGHKYKLTFDGKWEWNNDILGPAHPIAWKHTNQNEKS